MLDGKSILITGGTGSFGKAFCSRILRAHPNIKRVVIFSRDELKQYEMASSPEFANDRRLRFFIGDVRDASRLHRALEAIDFVVHAAALKQVPAAEYNPFEAVKTNVIGAQNLIESCLDHNISRVVALSTDKAAAPINLYGATKLCSDKLFTAANAMKGERGIRFSVVRYGNVMGSRGSVIPFFLAQKKYKTLPITHPQMTRFNITLNDGVDMVLWALANMQGGEIFVPKIPSYRIMDVANAVCRECEKPVVGIRPGEKLHEEMITTSDSYHTVDLGDYFAILPSVADNIDEYCTTTGAHPFPPGTSYSSDTNSVFLSESDIHELIQNNLGNLIDDFNR